MSLSRRAVRRDSNEQEIVAGLRKIGCTVLRLSGAGVPDLAVYWPPTGWRLGEVKTATGRLRPTQADWGHEIRVWRSLDDVLADLGVTRGC